MTKNNAATEEAMMETPGSKDDGEATKKEMPCFR
jgi:hypothetical protein